jgi:mRNA interferase RelE/StbE
VIVEFDKSFEKSIDKIKDKKILHRIENAIINAEDSMSIDKISNVKKLVGSSHYYRIKVGDYRMGFEQMNENTIRFIIVLHRKEIYRRFP